MSQTFEDLLDSYVGDEDRKKEFARLKFIWLEQVMGDPNLVPSARVLGFWILKHVNFYDLYSYVGLDRLRAEAKLSKATAHDGASQLQMNGHFEIEWGRPGRGHPNKYTPLIKGRPSDLSNGQEKVGPATYSSNATDEKRSVSGSEKVGLRKEKVGFAPEKVGPPNRTLTNTKKNTEVNTVRSRSARPTPADEEAVQQLQKFEEHLTGWKAKGAIDDAKASKLRTWFAQLLADVTTGYTPLEKAKAWLHQVVDPLNAFEAKPTEPEAPTAVEANGSAGDPVSSPCKAKKSPARVKPVDPKALLKQQVNDEWMAGKITRDEAAKRIAAIDAAPVDGHTN